LREFLAALRSRRPLEKTAPSPVLRTLHQSAVYRIPMDIAQFLDLPRFTPHWKIGIADLPETPQAGRPQLVRCDLFEHLHSDRELAALRFTDEQVHMFGHHHVAGDVACVLLPESLQFTAKDIPRVKGVEQLPALKTTEGDEMQRRLILITFGLCLRGTSAAEAGGFYQHLDRSGKPLRHPKALS
jgi:hypothetical protein